MHVLTIHTNNYPGIHTEEMFHFFALSEDVTLTLLSQWLSLKDISAVDAAL